MVMKVIRFVLFDFWVKIILWIFMGPFIMFPYKIIQYGISFGNRKQRQDTVAIRKALEKSSK